MKETESLLSVKNLTICLGEGDNARTIVDDLSFDVGRNEVVSLIGESGCGKSLSCLSIMGLLPEGIRVAGGNIDFMGKDLIGLDKAEMRSLRGSALTMILQNPMSCFDQIFTIAYHFRETLLSHGITKRAECDALAQEALSRAGFDNPREILGLYPFQMSGGMLQRVMVALAILMGVSLLIADEPTTDLDVVAQARILDLLMGLREEHGVSIVLVTHDLGVVARCADRVAVLRSGHLVEWTDTRSIFESSTQDYTKALVDAHMALHKPLSFEKERV